MHACKGFPSWFTLLCSIIIIIMIIVKTMDAHLGFKKVQSIHTCVYVVIQVVATTVWAGS